MARDHCINKVYMKFICIGNSGTSRRRGFSLSELLIVTAATAILAAILFPALERVGEKASEETCMDNLKKIGVGILQYSQDYDKTLPVYDWPDGTLGNGHHGWARVIQPYVKSDQIFQCPTELTGPSGDHKIAGYTDYAYNINVGWLNTNIAQPEISYGTVKTSAVTQPAQTVMCLDYVTGTATNFSLGNKGYVKTTTGLADIEDGLRHTEGIHYLLADGHVKWYKSSSKTTSAVVHTAGDCSKANLKDAPTFCYNIK